jgi:biotin carboxyl carrier protein
MKLTLTLQRGSRASEHQLELRSSRVGISDGSALSFVLDKQAGEADWAEVAPGVYSIVIGGHSYEAHVMPQVEPTALRNQDWRVVRVGLRHYDVFVHDRRRRRGAASLAAPDAPREVVAPMPGKIVKILVARRQEVAVGAGLLVIEAMKMQNELRAPRAGRVEEIYVEEGKGVETGAPLVRLA